MLEVDVEIFLLQGHKTSAAAPLVMVLGDFAEQQDRCFHEVRDFALSLSLSWMMMTELRASSGIKNEMRTVLSFKVSEPEGYVLKTMGVGQHCSCDEIVGEPDYGACVCWEGWFNWNMMEVKVH